MTERSHLTTGDIARAAAERNAVADDDRIRAEQARADQARAEQSRAERARPESDTSRRVEALDVEDPHDLALFPHEEAEGFQSRWEAIQTGFVDEPKTAVEQADALVAQVVTRLAEVFSQEKAALEQHWGRGDAVSTEDLRVALKRYRAFFHRLLSV